MICTDSMRKKKVTQSTISDTTGPQRMKPRKKMIRYDEQQYSLVRHQNILFGETVPLVYTCMYFLNYICIYTHTDTADDKDDEP